jgi:hypothetical protein
MRNALALTGLLALTALAGCGPKSENKTANAPTPAAANRPVAAAPALPPVPGLSPEACAVLGTYVKVELTGDFGLPVVMRVAPAKDRVSAADLQVPLPGLKAAEASALAAGLNQSIENGSQLDCDWKALGLPAPTPQTPASQAYIRFRPIVVGDVAILETLTDGVTRLGGRCLYRKTAGAWTREHCALTHIG